MTGEAHSWGAGRVPAARPEEVTLKADRYPPGTVRALLETSAVTPATREALRSRLSPGTPERFLEPAEYATLGAALERLVPQEGRERVDLAAELDRRLASGEGDGWRYGDMPPDGEAYRLGLRGLDETAQAMHGRDLAALGPEEQDAVLAAVAKGDPPGEAWAGLPAARFFEELLVAAVEAYYSHPLGYEETGHGGVADAPGWPHVGPGELEEREPRAVEGNGGG